MRTEPIGLRLEQYSLKHPQEVLMVRADIAGKPDQIVVFKGFSSSLMQPTAFDPDVPVLPETAEILQIDRLAGPYQPGSPVYLEQGLSLAEFIPRLHQAGV